MLDRLVALLGRHRTPIMQVVARSNPGSPEKNLDSIPSVRRSQSEKWLAHSNEEKCDQCKAVTPTQLDLGAARNGWSRRPVGHAY